MTSSRRRAPKKPRNWSTYLRGVLAWLAIAAVLVGLVELARWLAS